MAKKKSLYSMKHNRSVTLLSINNTIRLATIYSIVWFIDLLDGIILNVALPEISKVFNIDPTDSTWAVIGFLLAMAIGMVISNQTGNFFGLRIVYLSAQWLYLISSLACGLAINFPQLVTFRIFQGFGGGLAIPIGISLVMSVLPHNKWAKTGYWMNLLTLAALALGPILAGYITKGLSWRWLFFIKVPISLICVVLSHAWIQKTPRKKEGKFDWLGFYFVSLSLGIFLLIATEVGKPLFSPQILTILFAAALLLFGAFIWQETRASFPLVPMKIFHYKLFAWGNLVQSAANSIFLGATFIISLYLQWGLHFSIIKTGWILASITLGMIAAMPLTGRYYNKLGPLPYIIPGLLLISFSMFALIWVTRQTSPWVIALLIFCEGFGSALLLTTNFVSIFCEIPNKLKSTGSMLYTFFKQISVSCGIALSTMALSITLSLNDFAELTIDSAHTLFYPSFILLGAIPLLALIACFFIDNQKALKKMASHDHLDTEFEHRVE